jgi:hypothetical protein
LNKLYPLFGFLFLVILPPYSTVVAEPYFAVMNGAKCNACHVNPTGGGKRTQAGAVWAQSGLSESLSGDIWSGDLNEKVSVGADLRINMDLSTTPDEDDTNEFKMEEALLYFEFKLLDDRLIFYIDEQLAPSGASNREAYPLFWILDKSVYFKAGRFFLPYGLRIEDDTAFIRTVPGINYFTPDTGIETGLEMGSWSASFAITNGTAGGGEVDTGKQYSLYASFTQPLWRFGASFNYNDVDGGDRMMQNIFGGLKTGPVSWLAEIDYIVDDGSPTGRRKQWMSFLEANILVSQGHNLKVTVEHFEPDLDIDEDERNRYSFLYEYYPLQFTQLTTGLRLNDGIPQAPEQNTTELFLQLHNYF